MSGGTCPRTRLAIPFLELIFGDGCMFTEQATRDRFKLSLAFTSATCWHQVEVISMLIVFVIYLVVCNHARSKLALKPGSVSTSKRWDS